MSLFEFARRRSRRDTDAINAIADLAAGRTPVEVSREHGLPRAAVDGLATFYGLLDDPGRPRVCVGTACRFAGGGPAVASRDAAEAEVYCLGRCFAARQSARHSSGPAAPIPRSSLAETPVVLRHLLGERPATCVDDYALPDGPTILAALDASGLRGRGGAAYPTAAKWRAARDAPATPRVVVANGDEGDPGSYVDRLLLEEDPHAVLAGMVACARAIDAELGVVYVRGEYPVALERVRRAIAEAEDAGVLGGLNLRAVAGAGSYVAGEETALLRAIEGLRAEPSPKPPYPAERGLYGLPTVVQNIETLSIVPWIVRHRRPAGTKGVCLSGALVRPGLVEVPLGTPLREVLQGGGGGPPAGRRWKMALVGGPMGRVVPVEDFDVALSFEELPGMGHAGIVALDERVSARALFEHLARFAASESCGSCTPCRVGTGQLSRVADRVALERLLATLQTGSLCGFGKGVPRPIRDLLRHYPDELWDREVAS